MTRLRSYFGKLIRTQRPEIDREGLRRTLVDTVAWCLRSGSIDDPASSLRQISRESNELAPPATVVFHVRCERQRRLRQYGVATDVDQAELPAGRLLAFFPDDTLSDGAAAIESRGFFDDHNVPPRDTWVCWLEGPRHCLVRGGVVVSWVPPLFLDLANAGIEVNPESCIVWLDRLEHPIAREFKRLRLL